MPKFTDAEQTKLVAECLTMPLDAHARETVSKAEYAFKMMHQGAALPRCDWGIDWEAEGIEVLLPQMGAARALSSLACIRARMRFEEGRIAEALDDLVAATCMGRQVSQDGSLIGVLVGYHIEARMSEAVALHLPRLDNETIKKLKMRIDALPEGGNPAVGMRVCEEKTLDWFMNKVKSAKDQKGLVDVITPFALLAANPEGIKKGEQPSGQAMLDQLGGNAAAVLKFAEDTRPSYPLIAEKLTLPLGEFEKEFAVETKRQAGNPVFKLFFPAVAKVRQSQARAEIRRALLAAAFAVQLDGPDALNAHPDPVAGGPFEYTKFPGGFELRSKFESQNAPLVLSVGRREQ
jgi:hypothetical protein